MNKRPNIGVPSLTKQQIEQFDGEDKHFRCEPFKLKRAKKVKAEACNFGMSFSRHGQAEVNPYWSLPRTAEAYDQMVEQMAVAAGNYDGPEGFDGMIRAALRAIAITRPKESKQ